MISRFPLAAGMGCVLLAGCIENSIDKSTEPATQIKYGVYHSDYGAAGRSQAHESEMVLEADGRYHFFEIQDTTAWDITKGIWESRDGQLIVKSGLQRFAHYSYLFDGWDTLPNDTSYLRGISEDGFERLEVSRDSGLYYPVVRWVRYLRIEPAQVADGKYAFTETYPDYVDSAQTHSATAYMDLARNGPYEDGRSEDGRLLWKFHSATWSQLGSFLVVTGAHEVDYDSAGVPTDYALDSNSEYVARIRAATPDSFQQWIPPDQTSTASEHWVTWRRTPSR
jgi:hypothetical protein